MSERHDDPSELERGRRLPESLSSTDQPRAGTSPAAMHIPRNRPNRVLSGGARRGHAARDTSITLIACKQRR